VEEMSKFLRQSFRIVILPSLRAKPKALCAITSHPIVTGAGLGSTSYQTLILPGLNDTQCGFKCFRAEVAEDIFNRQTLHGWSFDIELLYIARRHGYRVVEIPIHWHHFSDSKVNALRDAVRMISDIFLIHANARRGLYDAS
jgi:hypothetical protein